MDITQYFYFWCKHDDFYGPSDSFFPPIYWFYESGEYFLWKKKFPIYFFLINYFLKISKISYLTHRSYFQYLRFWQSQNINFKKNHIVIKYKFLI
jgi:hypothetical protein